jgi:hypothetical protein
MRLLTISLLAVLLAACASRQVTDCTKLAGPGFSALPAAPPNADELLAMQSLQADKDQLWLAKGPDRLTVCVYATGLVVPSCGGSRGYAFARQNGRWVSRGVLLDICDN